MDEKYHGKGLGREIINQLIEQVKQCNIILYTHPNTVDFYEKLGFLKMKTGMAMYDKLNRLKLTRKLEVLRFALRQFQNLYFLYKLIRKENGHEYKKIEEINIIVGSLCSHYGSISSLWQFSSTKK